MKSVGAALLVFLATPTGVGAFAPAAATWSDHHRLSVLSTGSRTTNAALFLSSEQEDNLQKKFGGYTAKQRLREEVESPFRTFRLFFFGSSTASAIVAFYFSIFTAFKAYSGGFPDAPPLDEALTSCAINVAAVIGCGFLTYRDWQAGNLNLERIAKGGALAKLNVQPMASTAPVVLADYRRNARVLIAAGGAEYIQTLCRTLSADQLADTNTLAQGLEASDVILVPVLLQGDGFAVGDAYRVWKETTPAEDDRNFDINRASQVVAFPMKGSAQWADYLRSEVETAKKQGFDVLNKGFTIVVKKNGRILRRATGQPQFAGLIETMEVMDGSKFGMYGS